MERLEKLEDDIPLPDVFLSAAPEYREENKKIVAYQKEKEKERRKMEQNFIDGGLTKDQAIRSRRKIELDILKQTIRKEKKKLENEHSVEKTKISNFFVIVFAIFFATLFVLQFFSKT